MAPPWKKTYLDHGGSTSCGSRVFCRSVAASDQYNPCQWKPAIYGRADRGVYFRFVQDYKLVFRSPSDVEVIVYEKSVVGYVSYMNSRMYFDKDGIIVESTSETLPGVPKIAGLSFGHIVLHQPLPVEDISVFNEILNLTQVLSVNEVAVDEIRFNKEKEATLQIRSLKVELGSNSEMNGKLSELTDILRDYPDLSGTLYLDSYDESNANPMYRFDKN